MFSKKLSADHKNWLYKIYSLFLTFFPLIFFFKRSIFFESKTEMFLVCNFLRFIQGPYSLTSADGKYNLVEKKMSISTYKYRFRKRSQKFVIFKAANDRHSIKIGILKSMIKLLAKYLWRSFFSKAIDNSPKTLLKINSVTNVFQGFQTTVLT